MVEKTIWLWLSNGALDLCMSLCVHKCMRAGSSYGGNKPVGCEETSSAPVINLSLSDS